MSDDDTWLNDLAREQGENPLEAAELARIRELAHGLPSPWGAPPELSADLGLARVLRQDARLRQTRQRAWLVLSMAAALMFCCSPTLVRWRVERSGTNPDLGKFSQVGLVFWTSGASR